VSGEIWKVLVMLAFVVALVIILAAR